MSLVAGYRFSEAKILFSLKGLFPIEAPRPDGFHALFYQKYWDIVGRKMLKVVLGILNGNMSVRELNETFVLCLFLR